MGKKILAFLLVLSLFLVPGAALADECAGLADGSNEKVVCYENKIKESQGQQKTLANTISYLDNKISLKRAEIGQTEEDIKSVEKEIVTLSVKIGRLDVSLTDVSELLISRVGAAYKRSLFKPIMMLFSSKGLTDFFERNKYLQTIQLNDRKILLELQTSRDVHQEQKDLKQRKQEELEGLKTQLSAQRVALGGQKAVKSDLLIQTKNDEQKFQQLLAGARAEYYAIQAIIAGKGKETEVGHVNEGDKIATIIQGSSCNSSGTHIHFMVAENGAVKNPFGYLGNIDHINCSGPGGYSECNAGDPFNPSGDWAWPINPRVRFSQGYGVSWATQNIPWIWYDFHNGLDVNGESSSVVKAVKSGTLYQGSYIGGCTLRYVRVDHDNSNLDTLYLHINY